RRRVAGGTGREGAETARQFAGAAGALTGGVAADAVGAGQPRLASAAGAAGLALLPGRPVAGRAVARAVDRRIGAPVDGAGQVDLGADRLVGDQGDHPRA